jgi:hypothetical protein
VTRADEDPDDDYDVSIPDPIVGSAQTGRNDDGHDHPSGFLYVPTLDNVTGWATHEVPRVEKPRTFRPLGFRR